MLRRTTALFLVLLLLPVAAFASSGSLTGVGIADSYDSGMDFFALEDYSKAARCFEAACNFKDAKKWMYYCQAISSVVECNEQDVNAMSAAQARFELLAAQSFENAAQWAQYCKARAYEANAMTNDARALYATIVVHDSIERYLACLNKTGVLESAEAVRKRLANQASGSAGDFYQMGMDLYYLEDYRPAADYFCLAGNYQDARMWRCYCAAVALVTEQDRLEDGKVLFDLLSSQGFEAAKPWQTYCAARDYEQMSFVKQAAELYKTIFVYDSSDRYLKLLGY